ncbi:PAS domain-containing protein, partial [bacterium]|nr:PAS domain-containing protein [bacterium]
MTENSLYPILVISEQELNETPFGELHNKFTFEAVKPSQELLPILQAEDFALVILYKLGQNEKIISEIRSAYDMAQLPIAVVGTAKSPKGLYERGINQYMNNSASLQEIEEKICGLYSFSDTHRRLFADEERLKLAVKGSNSGIFDYDLINKTADYSTRALELLALENGEAKEGSWQDLTANIHPEEKETVVSKIENHLKGDSPRLEIQFRILYSDGTHRWILMRGQALRKDGEAVRLTGTVNDISSSLSYDNITGLPGRHIFFDLLERC